MLYLWGTNLHNSISKIPKVSNNKNNKYYEQFIITQASIESKKKDSDEKMMNFTEDFKSIIASSITSIMDQINDLESLSTDKDSPRPQYFTTVVPANRRAPPLDGGHYTKIGGMWILKHDFSTTKFYELLIKTELKG